MKKLTKNEQKIIDNLTTEDMKRLLNHFLGAEFLIRSRKNKKYIQKLLLEENDYGNKRNTINK